jgi:glycerol uptake facilitator-like aquaporin
VEDDLDRGPGGRHVRDVLWVPPGDELGGTFSRSCSGPTLAVLFLAAVFGQVGTLGATLPGPGITDAQAMLIELVLTAGLVSTILGTASRAQNLGPISAFGVAGYIILAGLWSSPISGASMNPARSPERCWPSPAHASFAVPAATTRWPRAPLGERPPSQISGLRT